MIIKNTRINYFYIVHVLNKQHQNDINYYSINKVLYLNTTMNNFKMVATLQQHYFINNI